jgi:hypothetical protein
MVHQLRSKTASEIFSHSSKHYHVDFKREALESFQAKLKFPGDTKYSKFAPILFLEGKRNMKKLFRCVELPKVPQHHIFYSFKFEGLTECLDVEVNPIWPWIFIFKKATFAYYTGKGLGYNMCNTWCYRTHGYSRESII